MQGHKRSARSERLHPTGQEFAGTAPLTGRRAANAIGSNLNSGDDCDDDGGAGSANGDLGGGALLSGGPHHRGNAEASHRLLEASAEIDAQVVYRNLWLFVWLKAVGSFDSGAFSAALGAVNGIGETWELDKIEQGFLTSSVFLGNVIGCPLAGSLFFRYNEKRVLSGALVIHTIFTFFFAAMPSYGVALVNRFFVGLTLAFILVYTPVWVDEFAPKKRQSVWMAAHNAGVPLGVMAGYIFAVGPQMVVKGLGWNWAFYLKCFAMIPTIAYLSRVDSRTINTAKDAATAKPPTPATAGTASAAAAAAAAAATPSNGAGGSGTAAAAAAAAATTASNSNDGSGSGGRFASGPLTLGVLIGSITTTVRSHANRALSTPIDTIPTFLLSWTRYSLSGFVGCCAPIFCNVVYICSVASLTSLYFVATGLQNFVTQYLLEPPFNASMFTIMVGFGSAVVTAPVCGVIVGGILLDRIGGYKRNLWRVTLFLFFWGGCAVFFSVVCIFAQTTRSFLLVMSVVLFCGGALIPPGAGLTMTSLPNHLRSTGAAFSQMMYNLLGNFSGPLVCGIVAEATGQLRHGIITLLLSSSLGVLPLFGILVMACRDVPLMGDEGSGGGGLAGAAEDVVVLEEGYEMDSVAGEDGDEAPQEAAFVGETDRVPDAPPAPQQSRREQPLQQQQQHQQQHPLSGEARGQSAPRELTTFNDGVVTRGVDRDGAKNGGSPGGGVAVGAAFPVGRPALPAVSPTSIASVAAASMPLSPLQQQMQPASSLLEAARTVHHSGGIQAPGTAHAVRRAPPVAPTPGAEKAGEARGSGPAAMAPPHVTNLEALKLESQEAQIISQPAEQSHGVDLVRSWLSTQQQQGQQLSKRGSFASAGAAAPKVA